MTEWPIAPDDANLPDEERDGATNSADVPIQINDHPNLADQHGRTKGPPEGRALQVEADGRVVSEQPRNAIASVDPTGGHEVNHQKQEQREPVLAKAAQHPPERPAAEAEAPDAHHEKPDQPREKTSPHS